MLATTVTIPKGARGVDSAQRLTADQIHAVGATFTCRYYAPWVNGQRTWKCLTPAETLGLHAAGIAVVPNWESSAARPLAGPTAGKADGVDFARQLKADGVPTAALVIVSCDMNATAANRQAVEGYFRAAHGALAAAGYRRWGVYGDTDLFAWLADLTPVGWLIASKSFSTGTTGASIAQRLQGAWGNNLGGVSDAIYDPNDVLADVAGVWLPHEVPAPPHIDLIVPPAPTEPEDDMATLNVITNADTYTDTTGTFAPSMIKWLLRDDGTKVHITEGYWAGIGAPSGVALPSALIVGIPDYKPTTATGAPAVWPTFIGTSTITLAPKA